MSQFSAIHETFTGIDGPGGISVPSLKIGDLVVWQASIFNGAATLTGVFELMITVDGEIQQSTGNQTSNTFTILAFRVS